MPVNLTLYAATGNPGKLREFAESARGANVEVLPLPGLQTMPEPVEDADSFAGNAALKARAYSMLAPGLLVMADDSGLEVDALGGAPGVRSARYAEDLGFVTAAATPGEAALDPATRDGRNNLCLLHALVGVAEPQRCARFRCVLAVARDGALLYEAEGAVEGTILDRPQGTNGFGYDPFFLVPRFGRSAAELTPEEKWSVSHRGRAFRQLLAKLA